MLTHATLWEMSVGDMCTTAAGDIAIRMGRGSGEIQVCDRRGRTHTTYTGLCTCEYSAKHISELIPGQYMAEICEDCNKIKVVDMVTREVHKACSGSSLSKWYVSLRAMCSGTGEGSLLVWDGRSQAVIQLQWDEWQKQLKEVIRVQVPGDRVRYMCYMPHTDLVILSRFYGNIVQAVKWQEGACPPTEWQLEGEVLGNKIDPKGVSCDSEGRVYVADYHNRRVLLLNAYSGEVIQQLLQDAELGRVYRVCCLSNPHQLLVNHNPPPDYNTDTLSLYNITSL